ncbi:hypothetical protein [Leisingera sp. McT4-56]|nr:hypothetical protein [Leisingera sp. McT4-56]
MRPSGRPAAAAPVPVAAVVAAVVPVAAVVEAAAAGAGVNTRITP